MKKVIGLALLVSSLTALTAFAQTDDLQDLIPADEMTMESVDEGSSPQAYSMNDADSNFDTEDFSGRHHPGHPGPHHPGHPGPHHPGGPGPRPGYPGYPGPGYPRPGYPGPGYPGPGYPPGGRQVECFAQDGIGRNFRGVGMYPNYAQQDAMNQCYSYSTYGRCRPTGCRRW